MSEKKKSLAVNSVYSVVYKLLNVLFPLVTSAYTARILLADGIGKVAYAQNIVQYFVIIAALGIPNYGIREIAKRQNKPEETNRVFTELYLINACSTTACVIIYYGIISNFSYFSSDRLLYVVVGLTLILNYINVDWFYQGKEEYGYIAVRNFFVKLVSLVVIFVFVRNRSDFVVYALITSLAIAGNNVLNILNLRGRVKFVFYNLQIRRHLKPVLILLASSISIELYTLLDTTMLGGICNAEIVGFYTNAVKLARTMNSTISSIALVLLPRLSYYFANGKYEELNNIANRVLKILITLTLPAATGVFLLSNDIILLLFGDSFQPAVLTLKILSVLVMAVALNNFFGTQILMTFGQETKLLISVICGAAVNITLNSILIPRFAQNGAAVASAISEIIVLLATFLFARKYIKFKLEMKYIFTLIGTTSIMAIAVLAIKMVGLPYALELTIGFIVGLIIFILLGIILKNDGVIDIFNIGHNLFNKILRKIRKNI